VADPTGSCPADGVLLAVLDGEVTDERTLELRGHLDACPRCRERCESLRAAGRVVRDRLRLLDEPAPARSAYDLTPRRSRRRLQWAAAAALVLAVGATAGPLRGWVAQLLRGTEPVPASVAEAGAEVTEVAASSATFSVVFTAIPEGAMLAIDRVDGERVRFEDPTGGAAVTVGTDRLEIRPGDGPSAITYRISLPVAVAALRVRGPGPADTLLNLDAFPGVLDLGPALRGN